MVLVDSAVKWHTRETGNCERRHRESTGGISKVAGNNIRLCEINVKDYVCTNLVRVGDVGP